MRPLKVAPLGVLLFASVVFLTLANVSAHRDSKPRHLESWFQNRGTMRTASVRLQTGSRPTAIAHTSSGHVPNPLPSHVPKLKQRVRDFLEGQRLFERETFGGNGRTCLTCHSRETGTVSPRDARIRFHKNPHDPLFVHDGSDDDDGDGFGDGTHFTRMLDSATILMRIGLHDDVEVKDHPEIRVVTVRRGIPTTLNTPALDPVLMLDGRQPTLEDQARGAIADHAQSTDVTDEELGLIAEFQRTPRFFSSPALALFALTGHHPPGLPRGRTASEKRGRIFFEDLPPDFSVDPPNLRPGLCAGCHSGPMLNQTNQFLPLAVPPGTRFQSVLVSEFNAAGNPVIDFVFRNQEHDDAGDDDGDGFEDNQDGIPDGIIHVSSPDPGRALITGRADDFFPFPPGSFDHLNAFKISPLRGIRRTAPYFHDNSARTLEDVAEHYRQFFLIVTDPDGPGPAGPLMALTDQDLKDMVAFMKLLN